MSTALATTQNTAPFFTADQQKLIRDSFLSGAPEKEALVLMELSRLRRLNPILGQIHFVKRWNSQRNCEVWAAQVGIDGFRAIAQRTGQYDGQDEPEWEYDAKGAVKLCRVRVYRKDLGRPSVGVAHFSEYAQTKKGGELTLMWATKPHIMLAKCAEALAYRKAFPEDTSGLYAPEEEVDEEPTAPQKTEDERARGKVTQDLKAALLAKAAEAKALPAQVTTFAKPESSTAPAVAVVVAAPSSTPAPVAEVVASATPTPPSLPRPPTVKLTIIDQAADETEAQAIARSTLTPYDKLIELGKLFGKTTKETCQLARKVLNKPLKERSEVTEADVRLVQAQLEPRTETAELPLEGAAP